MAEEDRLLQDPPIIIKGGSGGLAPTDTIDVTMSAAAFRKIAVGKYQNSGDFITHITVCDGTTIKYTSGPLAAHNNFSVVVCFKAEHTGGECP
jgi:hypothetical protein